MLPVGMMIKAFLAVAVLVLLAALVAGAIEYWPVTLLAIAGIVGVYVLRGKMHESLMQLKVKRDQQQKGLLLKKTVYSLNIRVEYSDEERAAINHKKLGGLSIFDDEKRKLRVTVRSLKDGHHLESDLKNLKTHIQVSAAFDGSAQVEEI
jgi:hypothetical protein